MARKKREPRGRPPVRGRQADPDAGWNENKTGTDCQAAVEQAGRIWKKIEDASGDVWDRAYEFFEDVQEKVLSVQKTIQKSQRMTERQQSALDNWEEGVDKWLTREE